MDELLAPHPHARAVLGGALRSGRLSHAYLLHGPAGSGKRAVARAFAAELLAEGCRDPAGARLRVAHGTHPDLTWVVPSGAHEMLRADVDEAVVSAASHTPFEATRRVFVLERADTMNDEAANRLLKTLEEPPSYVVLLLLTSRLGDVLPTIASRCQPVRFDPLAPEAIAATIGAAPDAAAARLCLGDVEKARLLLTDPARRERAQALARACVAGSAVRTRAWDPVLKAASAAGARAGDELAQAFDAERELLTQKDRRRREREVDEQRRRVERRARTAALDHALELCGLWFRDLACVAAGVPGAAHATDRGQELAEDAQRVAGAGACWSAVELVEDTRFRLTLNVSEDLACEALASRLERALAGTPVSVPVR